MSPQKIVSLLLVVAGVVLLIMGFGASDSIGDQMSRTFTGKFTEKTQWYLVGGAVSTIVGLIMLGTSFRGKSA